MTGKSVLSEAWVKHQILSVLIFCPFSDFYSNRYLLSVKIHDALSSLYKAHAKMYHIQGPTDIVG